MTVWFHGADSRPLRTQVNIMNKMYMLQYKIAVIARYSQQEELVFRSIYTAHTCISAFQIKNWRQSQETINLLLTTERYIILDQWILMERQVVMFLEQQTRDTGKRMRWRVTTANNRRSDKCFASITYWSLKLPSKSNYDTYTTTKSCLRHKRRPFYPATKGNRNFFYSLDIKCSCLKKHQYLFLLSKTWEFIQKVIEPS